MDKRFFTIDESTGSARLITDKAAAVNNGGPIVWAESADEASILYRAWRNSQSYIGDLKGRTAGVTLVLRGDITFGKTTVRNVIY